MDSHEEVKVSREEEKEGDSNFAKEVKEFYEAHSLQLYGMEFPMDLVEKLYFKLKYEVFDTSKYFTLNDNQDDGSYICQAKEYVKKNTEVFLIDHIWTFRHRQLNSFFEKYPELMARVYKLLKYANNKKEIGVTSDKTVLEKKSLKSIVENYASQQPEKLEYLEYDDCDIEVLDSLFINKETTKAVSLESNRIKSLDDVNKFLERNPNIKAIWLRNNPFEDGLEEYEKVLGIRFKNLELINRKFTPNTTTWALDFISRINSKSVNPLHKYYNSLKMKEKFYDLSNRDALTPTDLSLYEKFCSDTEILDLTCNSDLNEVNTSAFFEFLSKFPKVKQILLDNDEFEDYSDNESDPNELNSPLFEVIKYLDTIVNINPELRFINRYPVEKLLSIKSKAEFKRLSDEYYIRQNIWQISNTYRLMTSDKYDEDAIWYVMDEFGSFINHSDTPNVEVFPFIYSKSNTFKDDVITYSIMWNPKELLRDTVLTRDYLKNISEAKQRSSRLTAWFNTPKSYFTKKFEEKIKLLEQKDKSSSVEVEVFFKKVNQITEEALSCKNGLVNSLRDTFNFERLDLYVKENPEQKHLYEQVNTNIYMSITQHDEKNNFSIKNGLTSNKLVKVFSDLPYVVDNLKLDFTEFTKDISEADILFLNFDYFTLSKRTDIKLKTVHYKNQFPFENILTMKNLLSDTVQHNYGLNNFLNLTYNLEYELAEVIGNYLYNKENYINNTWILKPINMTRSMDMIVTNNLTEIIRACETGPKICQQYINRPLLLHKKKFDLRFIIMLKRLVPLELYFYSKMFWIRSANNDFTMDEATFSIYETHFTVMNYDSNVKMQTIYDHQFLEYLEKNNISWNPIYNKIKESVKKCFISASKDCPQMVDPYSRAVYGLDAMITEDLEPQILEINFSPDCTRACKFYPDFYNDIFNTLFFDKPVNADLI